MLSVFVVGIDRTENHGGCVTVSVLVHYFTLVAVMWMGAEALLMFQKFVLVFFQITTRYIVILSLVCWGTHMNEQNNGWITLYFNNHFSDSISFSSYPSGN